MENIHFTLILITCLFIIVDLSTGFVKAAVNHCIDSKKMKSGLWHKCGFIFAIIFAILCEYAIDFINVDYNIPFQDAVCVFIICTEVISTVENLGKISPELSNSKFMRLFDGFGDKKEL